MAPLQSVFCAKPAKGDAHKSSLVDKYSFSQVQPWSMVIKVCQGSTKALRNHLQAHHKKEFADMVKEEEKKFKATHKS